MAHDHLERPDGAEADRTISIDAAAALRERHGICMAGSGGINIAGRQSEAIAPFVSARAPFLAK